MSPGFGKGGQEILAMADGAATWDSAPILHPMRLPGTRSRITGGVYGEEEPLLESEEAYATPAGTELEPLPEPMHATVPIQADPVMSIKNAQHVAMMTLLITLAEAVLGTLAATALPAPTRHAEVVGSRTRVLTLLLATWFTLAIGAAWAFAEGFFMSLYDLSKVRTVATLGLIACIVLHGVATERENRARRLHDLPEYGVPTVVPGNETVPHLPPDARDHDHGHAGAHRVVVLKGDAWSLPAAGFENVQEQESLSGVAVMAGGEDGGVERAFAVDVKKGVNTAACRFAYEQGSAVAGVTDIRGLFQDAWTRLPPDARKEVLALLPQFDVQVDAATGERVNVDKSLFGALLFKHSVDVYHD
ncbi:hypothetical protein AMAG_07501 [Allomyces macrogynus ATCC 38327]|uniref:Uncharacterized protein n=1 Tax=Allomyces macrogynus (strain ATCC 38327) TaxID=578462 RepID=A0A0L0SIU0_ALLM3|nr:hypothetical protein AMAG_07501 [Allomyces macrogynus ATCC 38327]|eukprot:KNE62265.1 hypothetical protein AMAG_07501 [Allomyces macrogynus ATCC 38327]